MVFLFKLTVCWGLFALLYALLLRQETFFRLNRLYLLGTAALGIALAGASQRLLQLLTDDAGIGTALLPVFTVDLQHTEGSIYQLKVIDYLWIVYYRRGSHPGENAVGNHSPDQYGGSQTQGATA